MKRLLALLIGCSCLEAKSIITEDFIDRVAIIESNFNYNAKGDNGKALGAWQMHQPAWREACVYLANKGIARESWLDFADCHKKFYNDSTLSRLVCKAYFEILEKQMQRRKIKVTPIALYMAYNMGFQGAYDKSFDPNSFWLDSKRKSILARANHILSR
jgi:hypothetical protein